jgi:hypothetical protein
MVKLLLRSTYSHTATPTVVSSSVPVTLRSRFPASMLADRRILHSFTYKLATGFSVGPTRYFRGIYKTLAFRCRAHRHIMHLPRERVRAYIVIRYIIASPSPVNVVALIACCLVMLPAHCHQQVHSGVYNGILAITHSHIPPAKWRQVQGFPTWTGPDPRCGPSPGPRLPPVPPPACPIYDSGSAKHSCQATVHRCLVIHQTRRSGSPCLTKIISLSALNKSVGKLQQTMHAHVTSQPIIINVNTGPGIGPYSSRQLYPKPGIPSVHSGGR